MSGPFKAVGECLIYRFKRLPQQLQLHRKQQRRKGHQQENNKKKSNEQLLPQLQLQQKQQQHNNGEPTASSKPKTSTKPNTNTKSSLSLPSAPLPSLQRLWNVFIILAWLLLTFNVNKVRAGSESTTAAAVTFSHNINSTKLHAIIEEPSPSPPPPTVTVTVTRVTRINLTHSDHHPVVYPPKKKKHGIVAPSLATNNDDDNNNNEVIYVSSDEITTTTSDHIHSTSSPSSSSTIITPPNVSIYTSESFNDSSSFNATSYEGDIPEIPPYIRTTAMVFCIVIMLMGVIGNVMVSALAFALSHEL